MGKTAGTITIDNLNISQNMPDMTIKDFIAGVLKQFNLVCYGTSYNTFKFEVLDDWYANGTIRDITEYTDIDSIDIERIKLYKKISFLREESQSFMNVRYKGLNDHEYGSLDYAYDYDGEEYTIKLPFENLLHQKFTGTDLQVAYCLTDSDYKPYVPKPILLYKYKNTEADFYFNDGTGATLQTQYNPFGQDLFYNNANYSLNFGNEISSLLLVNIPNGAYQTYYASYLLNLYNRKNRLVYVKTNLPVSVLTSLKLNDRLIIRDKRYIINEMKSDLTTGEVNFVLMLDFRPLRLRQKPKVYWKGGEFAMLLTLPNGATAAAIDVGATGIVAAPSSFTEDAEVVFELPENPTPRERMDCENTDDLYTEEGFRFITEDGSDAVYEVQVDYTLQNGTIEPEFITFYQASW